MTVALAEGFLTLVPFEATTIQDEVSRAAGRESVEQARRDVGGAAGAEERRCTMHRSG